MPRGQARISRVKSPAAIVYTKSLTCPRCSGSASADFEQPMQGSGTLTAKKHMRALMLSVRRCLAVLRDVCNRTSSRIRRKLPFRPLCSLLFLVLAGAQLLHAWHPDTEGHITCDFANQWLHGRMAVEGRWRQMYIVEYQRQALAWGYQGKAFADMDRDILQKGMWGTSLGVEGPLYPPVAALFFAPLGALPPAWAHKLATLIYVLLALAGGWLLSRITERALPWQVAALFVLLFPNFPGSLSLGQNSPLTLFIVLGGWFFLVQGKDWAGGLLWGLLVYKPVFFVGLAWVPLLLGRWRFFASSIGMAAALCLATFPLGDIYPWQRWLFVVGPNAADIYTKDVNWIWMSRDLLGLPRRQLWNWEDFSRHVSYYFWLEPWDPAVLQKVQTDRVEIIGLRVEVPVQAIAWGLWGAALATTVLGYLACRLRSWMRAVPTDSQDLCHAFVLYGSMLTVYHFMHYDLLLLILPTALLLGRWRRFTPAVRWMLTVALAVLLYNTWDLAFGHYAVRLPVELFVFLALWVGAGWAAWNASAAPATGIQLSAGSHEQSSTNVGADGTVRFRSDARRVEA